MKLFRQLKTNLEAVDKNFNNVSDSIASMAVNPLSSAKVIQQVNLTSGQTVLVNHGLGRRYLTWWTANPSAFARIKNALNPDASQFVALVSDADLTVDLIVC
jgi:hypothetical protein